MTNDEWLQECIVRIATAPDPESTLKYFCNQMWMNMTKKLHGQLWSIYAQDYKEGKQKKICEYTDDPKEWEELKLVRSYYMRVAQIASELSLGKDNKKERCFADYLNGITTEALFDYLKPFRGNDFAREIQEFYKQGLISKELGGTQLCRYLKSMGLPYVPIPGRLNDARNGKIPSAKYNMDKSRKRENRFYY